MHIVFYLVRSSVLVVGASDVHIEATCRMEHVFLHEVLVFHARLLGDDFREYHVAQVGIALAFTWRET